MRKCTCIKSWNGLQVGDEVSLVCGPKHYFVAGITIDYGEYTTHFKELK